MIILQGNMNITIFIGSLYGGGAERVACNLANYLVKRGHNVELLTMAESVKHYPFNLNISNMILLKNIERHGFLRNLFIRLFRLKKYLLSHQVDCYVVMLPITTIILLCMRRLTNAIIIASERVDPSSYSVLKRFFLKKLAQRADRFIFQTDIIRQWYGGTVENKKAFVIPNAVNSDFIRPSFLGKRSKTIVSVGRLTNQKNFSLLIKSFAQVHKTYPEYDLVIYGEGPLKKDLIGLSINLNIDDKVFLPGQVENIAEKMESATMFVLSSDYEGMPNALMEAMALGLPCVATNCKGGGARFLIESGINGILIPANDENSLVLAMIKILEDNVLANNLGKNARMIINKFDSNVIYEKWEKCIVDACIEDGA